MQILLHGQPIPGFDHQVTVQEQIERKDLSGETSSTAGGHAGWKPALVQVRCKVKMAEPAELLTLRLLFHATDEETGGPALWDISEPSVDAMGIRQVQFTDTCKVAPVERLRVWEVAFTLIEVRSIPEKTEQRLSPATEAQAGVPEGTQTPGGETPEVLDPAGWFEEQLAQIDEALGRFANYVFPSD